MYLNLILYRDNLQYYLIAENADLQLLSIKSASLTEETGQIMSLEKKNGLVKELTASYHPFSTSIRVVNETADKFDITIEKTIFDQGGVVLIAASSNCPQLITGFSQSLNGQTIFKSAALISTELVAPDLFRFTIEGSASEMEETGRNDQD